MYDDEEYLMMSGIQHFAFCRRQWAMIHLEQQWAENVLTAEGRLNHRRCHDEEVHEKRGSLLTVRGIRVSSRALRMTGICDVVEFRESPDGIPIRYADGTWKPYPVEYKHGESKQIDADRIQLCAQVIALEEMLVCQIPEAALFYHKTRRRETVPMTSKLRDETKHMAEEMWENYRKGYTPKAKKTTHCRACSLYSLCLPDLSAKADVKAYISGMIGDNT